MYKFCQCKNGTHKISSSTNKQDKDDSFVVNCNSKKVYLSSNPPPNTEQHEHDEDIKVNTKNPIESINKHDTENKSKKPKKDEEVLDSIWSIFGIKNSSGSASTNLKQQQITCMIFSQSIFLSVVCVTQLIE